MMSATNLAREEIKYQLYLVEKEQWLVFSVVKKGEPRKESSKREKDKRIFIGMQG